MQLRQMWPFESQEARIVFCTMATDDLRDAEQIRFHFVVDYGGRVGYPILVQQQIISAQSMPSRSEGANEFWAISVMEGPVSGDIVQALTIHPFWFAYALQQHVQPHVLVNGRRVSGLQAVWQAGDFVQVRLQVWQNHHMLSILLREGSDEQQEQELEHTSFVQLRSNKVSQKEEAYREPVGEICATLSVANWYQPDIDDTGATVSHQRRDDRSSDFDANELQESQEMDGINELQCLLRFVMSRGLEGLDSDFSLIPDLHPFAKEACKVTDDGAGEQPVFHIYTDGSCKHDMATWAITVLQQTKQRDRSYFHRIGFAAGYVNEELGPCHASALDAEATAIIAMAEVALGLCAQSACHVHCHFDAVTVGFGAIGTANIPEHKEGTSTRQTQARIILTILQRKTQQHGGCFKGLHVRAHQGQPWNEMSDSIAKAVWRGWKPLVEFEFRSSELLQHELAEWAWLEVSPCTELPDIRTILKNDVPDEDRGQIDSTLRPPMLGDNSSIQTAKLAFATVNVRTLEYGTGDGSSVSWKVTELLKQFADNDLHIIGVQEARAKVSSCVHMGPFIRLISAGVQGQAGVELWINRDALANMLGIEIDASKDLCVWHANARVLAVRCSLGAVAFDVLVLYATQQGRGAEEVSRWWDDLNTVMMKRDSNVPVICLGDFNARVGSIISEGCDDHAYDVEDEAGNRLRQFVDRWSLMIPSTFAKFHEGPSDTFHSPMGHGSRIDFILISKESQEGIVRSFVDRNIDVLNGDCDHRPLVLEVGMRWVPAGDRKFLRRHFYDRETAKEWCKTGDIQLMDMIPEQPWSQDVNAHWTNIRQYLQEGASRFFPKKKRKPRQLYFSEKTWNLLCDRKDLRQQHRAIQREINTHMLNKFLAAWKGKGDLDEHGKLVDWDLTLLRQQEAVTLEARINTEARFRSCKKSDWRKWIKEQLDWKVHQANQASKGDLFSIVQPKKMIAKHAGKLTKPLPGYRGLDGMWKFSRVDIAKAWQQQFADIENAEEVVFDELLDKSHPTCEERNVEQLMEIPTLRDVEKAVRQLNLNKAPGLDGLGAELFKGDCATAARRIYPLVLKMGLRCQGVPELTGGWLLPLFKGKGNAQDMKGYRAILLEPVVARAISKAWRSSMVQGLARVAQPMQWGGRSGLSIESLHLQVQMWQAQARRQRISHALLFIDIRSAFYSVVKEMLTGCGDDIQIKHVFQRMGVPLSAWEQFQANVKKENTIQRATQSTLMADSTQALLQHTWFAIPDGCAIQAPATGSRPGDPSADVLFSFVMSRVLGQIQERACQAGMPLHYQDDITGRWLTRCVTWVDDLAVSVCASADKVVDKAVHMLSIIQDTMLEHGMILTCGVGKTAVMVAFHGEGATKARQAFERTSGAGLHVMSEHAGCLTVPVVAHYKHLGGHVTRTGSCLQEIRVRAANTMAKLHPLNKILKNPGLELEKKRILVHSIGIPVLTLHAGTWADLTQGEYEAWQAGVFRTYQQIHPRDQQGQVKHLQMYDLARDMDSPLPMELMYVQRLRLLFHIMHVADAYMIGSILHNHQIMQGQSWLHGAIKAVNWMRRQTGNMVVPEELSELDDPMTWEDFQPSATMLKRSLRKAQKSHLLKVKAFLTVKTHAEEQDQMLRELGWTRADDDEGIDQENVEISACEACNMSFASPAALAVHQQRKHGYRMAMRRFATDACCRVCKRYFHTRPRLLRHLHMGTTECWVEHCRRFHPMEGHEADLLDDLDRKQGVAMHQNGLMEAKVDSLWRPCDDHEMVPTLRTRDGQNQRTGKPSEEELEQWSAFGLLPPGQGGRKKTSRRVGDMNMCSINKAVADLEAGLLARVTQWQPSFDWVARPLATGQKYVLILFSGHRRYADIASWLEWQGSIQPISIDLAIDQKFGNVLDDVLWRRLIMARKVSGVHAAPPCETYTLARWMEVNDGPAPRPLRDMEFPWGRDHLSLQEVLQCFVGTHLMLKALSLMVLAYCHGASFSLEHPKGVEGREGRWTIWDSAMIQQLLLAADVKRVDFIQGPLGQPFTKPTSLLIGRLENFASELFNHYQPGWKPTEWLGGRESNKKGWRTAKAKAYPPLMCKVIAEAHLRHAQSLKEEGFEEDPELLHQALKALTTGFDPYMVGAKGTEMTGDYWRNVGDFSI